MQNVTEATGQNSYTTLNHCVACDSNDLELFLDLAEQPLANNYHDGSGAGDSYKLGLNVCKNCWHTQLPVSVNPAIMFENYLYVTGTSQTLRDYCDWFANFVTQRPDVKKGLLLDIACNDGTQLDSFKNKGWDTYGVDPAKNLYEISSSKGHNVTNGFWPTNLYRQFDVITAQNVCAHTPDPLTFLKGVKDHLAGDGVAFVQTSQSQMYQRNEFDTTYHEHISFFSVHSMITLAQRAGLVLTDVVITPIHGDSYVFVLKHEGSTVLQSVGEMLQKEFTEGRQNLNFYHQFGLKAKNILDHLSKLIEDLKKEGKTVIGYGAAAKGMTVLNARNIKLDWIIDDNALKQGLLTPGTNIPIKDKTSLLIENEVVLIPLAWNFFDEIKENVEKIRGTLPTQYLRYFPQVMFVS